MTATHPRVLLCDCEKTMRLDPARIDGLDANTPLHT